MAYSIDISQLNISPIMPEQPGIPVAGRPGAAQSTSEQATADDIGAVVVAGDQDGVAVSYDHVDRAVDFVNTDKGSVAVAAHEALADPHPQYTTDAEATAIAASAISAHVAALDPHPQYNTDAEVASAIGTHSSATDPHGDRAFATTADSAHVSATDPHGDRAYADSLLSGIGGVLPLVTGEVPPVLVYFDDGSLMYAPV